MSRPPLAISDEVGAALATGKPVVALETTVLSHGMPWPDNLDTALAVEATVRDAGALPAAIAVVDGRLRVGLDRATLERLARADDVMKLSRADLAYALAAGRTGATTVAATMIAARLAGIESSRPAASAASIAAPRRASTSRPISASSREPT